MHYLSLLQFVNHHFRDQDKPNQVEHLKRAQQPIQNVVGRERRQLRHGQTFPDRGVEEAEGVQKGGHDAWRYVMKGVGFGVEPEVKR